MRREVMNGDHTMSDVRRAALAMGPLIREQADEIERQRRLTPPVVEGMKQAGIYAMSMPKAWGGLELDLPEQLRVLETLARYDGSVGWCASVGIGCGYASAWLTDQAGRELMPDVNSIFAGSALFAGRALRVDGGYRVSGRWPFNSGCHHATVFGFNCNVVEKDPSLCGSDGSREMRFCYLPASQGRIVDTWYSTGLCGSGSHDVEVTDVFVPEAHCAIFPVTVPLRSEPLYAHPLTFAYVLPAVALGIASHAFDAFIEIANHREITLAALGGQKVLLRTSPHAQVVVSQAEGLIRSARSFVYEVINEIWGFLVRKEPLSQGLRASFAAATTNAHRSCTKAVDFLYKANGGASVYPRCPSDRCFRDIHTISQHHFTSVAFDEKAGQVMLGLEPADQMF
jgi:indole-3-acetate monooxygenase